MMNYKKYVNFYLLLGIGCFIVFIDTLFDDADEKYSFFWIQTNKSINLIILLILAVILISHGIKVKSK